MDFEIPNKQNLKKDQDGVHTTLHFWKEDRLIR